MSEIIPNLSYSEPKPKPVLHRRVLFAFLWPLTIGLVIQLLFQFFFRFDETKFWISCNWLSKIGLSQCVGILPFSNLFAHQVYFLNDQEILSPNGEQFVRATFFWPQSMFGKKVTNNPDDISASSLSDDKKMIAVCVDRESAETSENDINSEVWIWDIGTRQVVKKLPYPFDLCWLDKINFLPGNEALAFSDEEEEKTIVINLNDGSSKEIPGNLIAVSPASSVMATRTGDQTITLWQLPGYSYLREFRIESGSIRDISFSPDGSKLGVTTDDSKVYVWNVRDGQISGVFPVEEKYLSCNVVFSPDSSKVFTCTLSELGDNEHSYLYTWKLEDGSLLDKLELPQKETYYGLDISSDGSLVTVAGYHKILVYKVK